MKNEWNEAQKGIKRGEERMWNWPYNTIKSSISACLYVARERKAYCSADGNEERMEEA